MKSFAATLLVSVASGSDSPCVCIFDVDSTLISWSTTKKCPKVQDSGVSSSGSKVLRAQGAYKLHKTFCSQCYLGVISAGSAGTTGGGERKDIVKTLQKHGGMLPTDTWNANGCAQKHSGSPLVTGCTNKPSAVKGILGWYTTNHGVTFADENVHFYDDKDYNIASFAVHGYNAYQIACPTDGDCAMEMDEVNSSPGIYCCSGGVQQLAPASSSITTGCGVPCHFPFKYLGKTYKACTTSGDFAPWCATTANYDEVHWGYCGGSSDVTMTNDTAGVIV